MVREELSRHNPLRVLGRETQAVLSNGAFGAITARAGVGKTSFLIQVALGYLVEGIDVLHVSLKDPVDKVSLWYTEVFRNMTEHWGRKQAADYWETLLPHRFIMTYRAEGFSTDTLAERLTDLSEQGVFTPRVLVIDGFRFDGSIRDTLLALRTLAETRSLSAWFTVRIHRHDPPRPDGMPAPLADVSELFEVIIQLQPLGSEVHVIPMKGGPEAQQMPQMMLDPSTLMVKHRE